MTWTILAELSLWIFFVFGYKKKTKEALIFQAHYTEESVLYVTPISLSFSLFLEP